MAEQSEPRRCPIETCQAPIKLHELLCHDHWFAVAYSLRREVTTAYREYLRRPTLDTANRLRVAQSEAVADATVASRG